MPQSLTNVTDRAYDILRSEYHPLDAIFAPKNIAVIGATEKEGSVGRTLLWNLISNPFGGTVFPINPKRNSVLGIKAYPKISDLPESIDLAIIATPSHTVPGIIGECIDAGVKGAITLSAGFKETGETGLELEKQILEQLRRGSMRLIGPNCLGIMNPHTNVNATFASSMALPGKVGFISQSGAFCTAILDWSFREHVGFSAFISIGSMLDVDWGDLIYYLGDDPNTESIVIYMESIGNARSFLSAAREVALTKPIILIKPGRTVAAAKAAASHTGALTGSDAVLDAALRRCGVLRVDSISELFDMAEILAKQPRPKGKRLTIVTNAGGPGVIATDALVTGGGELAQLSEDTKDALKQLLPANGSYNNPIDLLGDADPSRYAKALEIAAKDPNSDGLLVILTPQAMTDGTQTAQLLQDYAHIGKPVLASWMGDIAVEAGSEILNKASITTFPYPDTAARMFNYMWHYSYNLRSIYETPVLPNNGDGDFPDRALAEKIISSARKAGRTLLTEAESKELLAAYGIPTVTTHIAVGVEEAVKVAGEIGYPVVVKLFSETITHKTDVGGVRLNLHTPDEVRSAYQAIESSVTQKAGANHFAGVTVQPMIDLKNGYELILGSSIDSQFGPVLLFGCGGELVEVFQDRALGLPPLNTTLARRMMEQTRIYKALQGVRGKESVNLAELEQLIVRFSQLVVEQSWIEEIDINPLLAKADGNSLLALDARVVLQEKHIEESQLPKLAIRPYPNQYISNWKTANGTEVTIRPIRPEDEPLIIKFHHTISEESVYFRYFHMIKLSRRIAHERLTRLCFIDYDRQIALVADYKNLRTQEHEILAVARLSKLHGKKKAEFALIISDRHQCQGLGSELLQQLLQIGRDENLKKISAEILAENTAMQHVCKKLGFTIERTEDPSVLRAEIDL
ncbi:bifunctional acetate--CoA ligase family protein/GNAT family N-acetyltransferase [Mastigocoleus sp. MO_188.B34]|uniref:bifunctional acetate--CoA ligase family protein/GNAT family N-acetyltransferase n=1 Tax=Mastigocoleus sp. MO_188.B34 TaxID=3036635 RepID=UPI002626422B|nr:bifunctional acetate--CoA ligase family protein/GNAT family N-acetyltransferase [Mastigocoleus sp. MO_188.B34]MDJ0693555.1 bifunctional acetate--CoA ligase family protein/GNAT family N-acetyltransferase [Mastigocoleus sp. MO_188.B34]